MGLWGYTFGFNRLAEKQRLDFFWPREPEALSPKLSHWVFLGLRGLGEDLHSMQLRLDQASFSTMRVPTLRDLHLGFRALGFKGFRVRVQGMRV